MKSLIIFSPKKKRTRTYTIAKADAGLISINIIQNAFVSDLTLRSQTNQTSDVRIRRRAATRSTRRRWRTLRRHNSPLRRLIPNKKFQFFSPNFAKNDDELGYIYKISVCIYIELLVCSVWGLSILVCDCVLTLFLRRERGGGEEEQEERKTGWVRDNVGFLFSTMGFGFGIFFIFIFW